MSHFSFLLASCHLLTLLITVHSDSIQTYIVHMDLTALSADNAGPPTPKLYSKLLSLKMANAALREENIIYTYGTALTGFAATLSDTQLESLRNVDGFLAAYPDKLYALQTTYTPHFLGLTGHHGAWALHGSASDIIIGVLDTGIWPEHPSFAGKRGPLPAKWKGTCQSGTAFNASHCTGKLIGARVYYRGYESAAGKINEKKEYKSPRDNIGHGTHTASTAAGGPVGGASIFGSAKGTAAGMAPGAKIAAYKVCWSAGCATSDIMAGIDAAVADGVDVLSLSLGGSAGSTEPFYLDGVAVGTFGAIAKGIFVTCSAGNAGPGAATLSNGAPWITTVAASSVDRTFPAWISLGNGSSFLGGGLYPGRGPRTTEQVEMVYGYYCRDSDSLKVRGKIVVCERGITSRVNKGIVVSRAGGVAMVLLNTASDGEELTLDPHVLPAVIVGAKAAKVIRSYVQKTRNATARIVLDGTRYGQEEAPAVTAFSSRGPNLQSLDILKPDLTAPGLNVLAAWPANLSPTREPSDQRRVPFNFASGTSMSCPHVAGLAALVRSAHPGWSAAAVKSALMTTAYVTDNRMRHIPDLANGSSATPFAVGAGHVHPGKAFEPGLVYDADTDDYVEFFCALNYSAGEIGVFKKRKVSCPKQRRIAGDLNYPSVSAVIGVGESVNLTRKVTNVGKAQSNYRAKMAVRGKGIEVRVTPRRLVFTKVAQRQTFMVSIVAKKGNVSRDGEDYFGSITWVSCEYSVRSPVSVTVLPRRRDVVSVASS